MYIMYIYIYMCVFMAMSRAGYEDATMYVCHLGMRLIVAYEQRRAWAGHLSYPPFPSTV